MAHTVRAHTPWAPLIWLLVAAIGGCAAGPASLPVHDDTGLNTATPEPMPCNGSYLPRVPEPPVWRPEPPEPGPDCFPPEHALCEPDSLTPFHDAADWPPPWPVIPSDPLDNADASYEEHSTNGGQGWVEGTRARFDDQGRRTAYWLKDQPFGPRADHAAFTRYTGAEASATITQDTGDVRSTSWATGDGWTRYGQEDPDDGSLYLYDERGRLAATLQRNANANVAYWSSILHVAPDGRSGWVDTWWDWGSGPVPATEVYGYDTGELDHAVLFLDHGQTRIDYGGANATGTITCLTTGGTRVLTFTGNPGQSSEVQSIAVYENGQQVDLVEGGTLMDDDYQSRTETTRDEAGRPLLELRTERNQEGDLEEKERNEYTWDADGRPLTHTLMWDADPQLRRLERWIHPD